jgi:hypothetical protein
VSVALYEVDCKFQPFLGVYPSALQLCFANATNSFESTLLGRKNYQQTNEQTALQQVALVIVEIFCELFTKF